MIKFASLLNEDKNNSPVTSAEQKSIRLLEKRFGDVESTHIVFNIPLSIKIMTYIKEKLLFPKKIALEIFYLYKNNILDIREEDKEWTTSPDRGYYLLDKVSIEKKVMSDYLGLPFEVFTNYPYDGMAQFDIIYGGNYIIGTKSDTYQAISILVDQYTYGLTAYSDINTLVSSDWYGTFNGGNEFVNSLYVPEGSIESMAEHHAINRIKEEGYSEDMEFIQDAAKIEPDIDKRWSDLETRIQKIQVQIDKTPPDSEAYYYLKEKEEGVINEFGELTEESENIVTDSFINEFINEIKDLPSFLEENEYITQEIGYYHFNQNMDKSTYDYKKLPHWVKLDVEKLKDLIYEEMSNNRESYLESIEGEVTHNIINEDGNPSETYYIYRIE